MRLLAGRQEGERNRYRGRIKKSAGVRIESMPETRTLVSHTMFMTMLTLTHEHLRSLGLRHAHSDAVSALPYRQAEKDHSTDSGAEYKASQLPLSTLNG